MAYIDPRTVRSPRNRWTLIEVLHNDGPDFRPEGHSVAVGEWDSDRVLAMRWNGNDDNPGIGHPQSRGLPTWFIIPKRYNKVILETLPENRRTIARTLLGLVDE